MTWETSLANAAGWFFQFAIRQRKTENEWGSDMSEAEKIQCALLVLQCQRHDRRAWTQLIELFEKPLLYYLRRLIGSESDAWDVFQETWILVLRSLPNLKEPRAFPVYLYRTGRNAALGYMRKRGVELRVLSTLEPGDSVDNSEPDFSQDDCVAVHFALEKLSLPHREVLTLFFLQDMSVEEIASVLEIPSGTVKSRLHHAKHSLANILSKRSNHDSYEFLS